MGKLFTNMCSNRNNLVVLSANCQGLQTLEKRRDVLSFFKDKNINILCLEDTHLCKKDISEVKEVWGGDCFISGRSTNSRGVAILLKNNFEYEILDCKTDDVGNYLLLVMKLYDITINLLTIYGPNNDNPAFYNEIPNILNEADYTVICGDFNIALDPSKDTENYKNINNPKAHTAVLNMMEHLDLMDVYRHINPNEKRYTWRKKNPRKQARLDFFLITSHMIDIIHKANIRPGYRSDHSVTEIEIVLNRFKRGRGIWKFNNSLLKQKEYLNLINNAIQDEIFKYAIPVHNINFLNNPVNYGNIDLVIDSDIFLEVLFLRLRGESIKFFRRNCKI